MKWIDLSADGMKLVAVELPETAGQPARRVLVMTNGDRHADKVAKLGFAKHAKSGAWVLMSAYPTFAEIQAVFPNAKEADFEPEQIIVKARPEGAQKAEPKKKGTVKQGQQAEPVVDDSVLETPEAASEQPDEPKAPEKAAINVGELVKNSTYLGLNRQGKSVYQSEDNRFLLDSAYESPRPTFYVEGNMKPGLFLYGDTPEDIRAASEGFIFEANSGEVRRYSDLVRFAQAVFNEPEMKNDDPRIAEAHAVIHEQAGRFIAGINTNTMRERYTASIKLHDSFAFVSEVTRNFGRPSAFLPLPLQVTTQRIVGSDLDGKSILLVGLDEQTFKANLPKTVSLNAMSHEDAAFEDGCKAADITVMNLPLSHLDSAVNLHGSRYSRADVVTAIASLEARQADGRSVILLQSGIGASDQSEIEDLKEYIASRFSIEGMAEIDGALHGGPVGSAMVAICVGEKLSAPSVAAAPATTKLADFASTWSWTAEVVAKRAQLAEKRALEIENEALTDEERERNSFQAPYTSLSAIGQASTMIPRNLEADSRDALGRIAEKYGDIDEWVAGELAMTKEQMADVFSPEQIDALALAIDADVRGRAFLNADEMGVGKGRFLAAMMRRAILKGKKVVFLTEKESNLSDIWRDIVHINSAEEFSPLFLNADTKIIDEETQEVVMKATDRDILAGILESGEWPDDYNVVFGTYSQFNQLSEAPLDKKTGLPKEDFQVSEKSRWLLSAVDNDVTLFLDESHNVSTGVSNTGRNVDQAIDQCHNVFYSSATYSKKAKTMAIYKRLFPRGFETVNLAEVLRRGGDTMQETLSGMLVRDGVMVRREHDLSKCDIQVALDEENQGRNREYMDLLAPVLAEMAYMSGDLSLRIGSRNDEIAETIRAQLGERATDKAVSRRLKKLQVNSIAFGSPLYNISRLFTCALLVDKAASVAIEALENNRKPVILVDKTMQAVLESLAEEQAEQGQALGRAPDFKDMLLRSLAQLTRTSRKDAVTGDRIVEDLAVPDMELESAEHLIERLLAALPDDIRRADMKDVVANKQPLETINKVFAKLAKEQFTKPFLTATPQQTEAAITRVRAMLDLLPNDAAAAAPMLAKLASSLPEDTYRAVKRIRAMIMELPDLPGSPIDALREKLEEKGYRCGEITGRTWEYRDGSVIRKPKTSKTVVKNAFNRGDLDAVIINSSGSTGIDLHAGARFKDQRQREFIELQGNADISKQVQAWGRVNRYDQVIGPIIRTLMAGLPIEFRLLAMRNSKLRRLSASTTSNRESAALLGVVPDLINEVGDQVCARYAEARPDLLRRLGFAVNAYEDQARLNQDNEDGEEDSQDNQRSANMFLARLAMLPYAQQLQTFTEIENEYRATVEELDARGSNPLKTRMIDGIVHLRDEKVAIHGFPSENLTSAFHEPVYQQGVVIEHAVAPLRGKDIVDAYERGLIEMGANSPDAMADRLVRYRESFLKSYLPDGVNDIDMAIAQQPDSSAAKMSKRMEALTEFLLNIRPGSELEMTLDGVVEKAVVTNILMPRRGFEHLASSYSVHYVVPGMTIQQRISVQALLNDPAMKISDGLNGEEQDAILKRFDYAMDGQQLEKRIILSGNSWQAMALTIKHKLGNMVSWEDPTHGRSRGILVSKRFRDLSFLPISITDAEMAGDALNESRELVLFSTEKMSENSGLVLKKMANGRVQIEMPNMENSTWGFIYEHPPIQALYAVWKNSKVGDVKANERPKFEIEMGRIKDVLRHFEAAGIRFYAESGLRVWANEWNAKNYHNIHGNQEPDQPEQVAMAM
ncbi:strawberry notch C-terminal domain-containing protein [Thalassospira xianhensis]|uniref:strawberry notch C-terminal domain-containing protein n=1 Tax=Thalassospira xianhensis TaxID=478503 RepID=UPI000DEDD031|nr:strawberry notch C-terminal domain-containing protein [Thalassospira xianhensis]